jgi:uncharacterized membrane protein
MSDSLILLLRLATALGCGLMAGVYFAFSTAVMGGLGRLEAAAGIAAMQHINRAILNPIFLVVFIGTAGLCLWQIFFSLSLWPSPAGVVLVLGSSIYLLGSLAVTATYNVPLNNALAALNPQDPTSAVQWSNYLTTWTNWNHLRAIASLAATALMILGAWL